VADKSSSGNAGNDMPIKDRSCRHGADLPKKAEGTTFRIGINGMIDKCVNSGNGCSIRDANVSHAGVEVFWRQMTDTR